MRYKCNNCGETIQNNGGSAKEVGMLEFVYMGLNRKKKTVFYCYECAKEIAQELIDEI